LFLPEYIEAAERTDAEVLAHPGLGRLEETFAHMARLREEFGFRVTVAIAPSAIRLHGGQFAEAPAISDEPYFIKHAARLAAEAGFDVVDLLPLMRPAADSALLYWRDDSHWNVRGHAVVAAILAERLK
jgi:hypothetical protein